MATIKQTFQPQILTRPSQLSINTKESLLCLLSLLLESETFSLMQSKGFLINLLYFFPSRNSTLSPVTL